MCNTRAAEALASTSACRGHGRLRRVVVYAFDFEEGLCMFDSHKE